MSLLAYLLCVAAIMAAVVIVARRVSARQRRLGKKCPGCGTRMDREESCVSAERRDGYVVLPRVDLVRQVCSACGRENRELVADSGAGYWEAGKRGSGPTLRPGSPDVSVATIKEIREWDRAIARLEEEHRAKLRMG
jgi:hypothetical protein